MKEKFLLKIQNISEHILFLTLGLGLTILGDKAWQMPEYSRQTLIFYHEVANIIFKCHAFCYVPQNWQLYVKSYICYTILNNYF